MSPVHMLADMCVEMRRIFVKHGWKTEEVVTPPPYVYPNHHMGSPPIICTRKLEFVVQLSGQGK